MSLPLFLQDRRFLQELDQIKIKEQFIKITVLNWNEEPLQQVQGIVISGNINLDGSSSMRRTGTLSIFAQEENNNLEGIDNLFSINKKCMLEIGIVNTVLPYTFTTIDENKIIKEHIINYQEKYGNIVWFPLGLYIMFNPSITHDMNGVTIAMNLKDKMCLLNGDLGGAIHSSVDLLYQDEEVDVDTQTVIRTPVLLYDMVKELVHHWGNESFDKIIIEDIPLKIKSVVKWNGDSSIWMKIKDGNQVEFLFDKPESTTGYTQIEPGYDIGYKLVKFTYPAEQFYCNAGDTVTSILDKIISVLGNFEYYYDVEGNFIFHQKQNNLNTTYTAAWMEQYTNNSEYHTDSYLQDNMDLPSDIYEIDNWRISKPVYSFTYNNFVTSYNNTLNYNNIKNDFVVWGARTTSNGVTLPCRYHLAIDDKPFHKRSHEIALYKDSFGIIRAVHYDSSDEHASDMMIGTYLFPWEEEEQKKGRIFQIYSDKRYEVKFHTKQKERIRQRWLQNKEDGTFWDYGYLLKELKNKLNEKYNPEDYNTYTEKQKDEIDSIINSYINKYSTFKPKEESSSLLSTTTLNNLKTLLTTDGYNYSYIPRHWRVQIYCQMLEDEYLGTGTNTELNNTYFQYYAELKEQLPKWYNIPGKYYNVYIAKHPDYLEHYLDFISESELSQYSVNNIGRRSMVVDDSENINCVFEPTIPDIVFFNPAIDYENGQTDTEYVQDYQYCKQTGSLVYQDGSGIISENLAQGGYFNSCYEKIRDLLYQYTHMNNTVSLSCIPIYYLEPNTRVTIEDDAAGVHGDFIIQSISLPLDVSSTMSINAYKALRKI